MGNRHRHLASLLVSFLALSPTAIDFEAPNNETIEAVKRAQTQAVQVKKPYKRVANRVKPAEIRRARWKRFKYELALKTNAFTGGVTGDKKGKRRKGKERWIPLEEVPLKDVQSKEIQA